MLTGLALGASLGAGVMYLMDPRMGRRRRALISDKVTSAGHKTTDAFDATWKDMRNRAQGMWASMTSSSPSRRGNMPRPQFSGARMEWMQENWSPAARAIAIATGGTLALSTARLGKGLGIVPAMAGIVFAARGLANLPVKRLFGLGASRRGVDIHKTINISAPIDEVFAFWTDYENFPRFMSKVREVRDAGMGRSHWIVAGPGGTAIEWNAVLTNCTPYELLAWKTEPDSVVQHAGIIRFHANHDGSTTVNIKMSYNPPAGAIGYTIASLLGWDPKTMMDEDLARMKTMIETGKRPRDAAKRTRAAS